MFYIFLADGFEETEAIAPLDIMRRAGIDVKTVGITGKVVTGVHDISVTCDLTKEDVQTENLEGVMLPGGLKGTENLYDSEFVKSTVLKVNNNNGLICAICAAPSILGRMGLLKDKKATCYPGFEKYFDGGEYIDKSVVKDNNFITSDGMGSAYKFGFEIVTALKGGQTCENIKNSIQYR